MNINTIVQTLAETNDLESWKNASHVIKHLYGSFGKMTSKKWFRELVQDTDEHTHALLELLLEWRLFTYKSVKQLSSQLDKAYSAKNNIIRVQAPEKYTSVAKKEWDNADIKETDLVGVVVHEQGNIYKRTLNADINKLLK